MTKIKISAIIIDSILIILTLSFIFGNSLKNVEKSTNDSMGITEIVEKLPQVQDAITNNKIKEHHLDGIVRSFAHALEFAVLGAEIMLLFLLIDLKPLYLSVYLPFFICLILGLADESLQMLSDRAAEVTDVIKDFAGAVIGGLATLLLYKITGINTSKKQ